MNAKSYAKVMAMKTHELAADLHWVSMWMHADDGKYELAMTSQLLYLANRQEWIDLADGFSDRDWQTLSDMHHIVMGRDW